MYINKIKENLCIHDKRNPYYDFENDERILKDGEKCFCDNCFNGRHKLADEILKLIEIQKFQDSKMGDAIEFKDKRHRIWEVFCDESYYQLICVRLKDDTTFNSATSFHFDSTIDANIFIDLLKKSR